MCKVQIVITRHIKIKFVPQLLLQTVNTKLDRNPLSAFKAETCEPTNSRLADKACSLCINLACFAQITKDGANI
jgi:hypothetical protein